MFKKTPSKTVYDWYDRPRWLGVVVWSPAKRGGSTIGYKPVGVEQTIEVGIAASIHDMSKMEYLKGFLDKGMLFGDALEEVENYFRERKDNERSS